MSAKRIKRQKPVHLDHLRRENNTRECLRANMFTSSNGPIVENVSKGTENTLKSYPVIYVNENRNGLDFNSNDTCNEICAEGDYVTLMNRSDDISNASFMKDSEDCLKDSGRDLVLKHMKEDITPVNGITRRNNSDDGFNCEDGVYETLVSDNITLNDGITGEERDSGNGDEVDIWNFSDSLPSPDSQNSGGKLRAKTIEEPLSQEGENQPFLKLDPFSDTESLLSTEVNRTDYLKQLRDFEHSIDGAVWRRKLWQMESKRNNAKERPKKTPFTTSADDCGEFGNISEKKLQNSDTNIKSTGTESDEKVSLEDIIQDFLQYFQTKRHSVKSKYGSIVTKDDKNEASRNNDIKTDGPLEDKLQMDFTHCDKAMYSSVLNVGRRRSRTDEKLDIFEARLLRRSRSHLDTVKAIRVRGKIFSQNRFRESIQVESGEDSNGLGQRRKTNKIDPSTHGEHEKGVDKELILVTDDSKADETININYAEKEENTDSDTEPGEQKKDSRDIARETADNQAVKIVRYQACSDIVTTGLSGDSRHLDGNDEENVSQVPYLGRPVNTHSLQAFEKTPSSAPSGDEPPLPPPRRPIRNHSRRPRSQYDNPTSSSRNYTETSPVDSQLNESENIITSSRSPSIRKRDIMMRRYNSTSALPLDTPVDMNKNLLMDSRGEFSVPTNGHNDNEVREDTSENGNQSNIYLDDEQSLHPFVHMDIVGESYEARYPWQRDISTQCNLSECRHSISSGSVSSGSELSNYTAANNQNCSNYINSNCIDNRNSNPARRQSSDNIRKRHHVFKTRRPRSMTCLDTSNIYNTSSDMYRSDTNLNYRHGRTMSESCAQNSPNRKRMPLLLADDPGSVSDLESILENPYDGNPDRNFSVGGDSLSTEQLRRLEEIRGSSADLSRDNSDTASSSGCQPRNVLPSPRVSPEMWSEVPEVVVNTERDDNDPVDKLRSINWNSNYLSVPRKPQRRLSSGSLQSGSDESDNEIAPPIARRGRRAAIVDTKNFGDVSPTQLSPDISPSNSCDEGESGSNIAERLRRRRSSHDVSMNVYPGDLLVQEHHKKLIKRNTISDFYAGRNGSTPPFGEDNKKQRQPFSLLKLMKTRSKESLHLGDVLKELKASEFKDNHLAAYKSIHWTDLIASTDKQTSITDTLNISEMERKRRESVWELFKSECVFLIDHLMVLKHCFLEPLKKCQVEGFLMYAEPSEIFSNLDELCYVSYTFCKDFIASLLKDMSATDFGSTAVLIKAFQRFSKHSKDGSVYHTYCLNYTNALSYLEKLRKNDEFCEFEKWCEQDQRCNRLQLADLLIGPMQHCTKLPLLLHNIQKYTEDPVEKTQIVESIEKVEMSLRQLEEKMKWLKNFERVQEIQRHLIWPSITDLDSRAFIPEYLKPKLSRQPCERLLACPSRQLINEGPVTLTESTKSFDAYMFLFDDILLITKIKKPNRKKQSSSDIHSTTGQPDNQMYTVHRQPIALDRLGVHDVMPPEATANGLKSAFVIVQISRFQQIIDVFTLQAASDVAKASWISQILEAKSRCRALNNVKGNSSSKESEEASPTGCTKRGRHGKSLSIDAVFL